MRTPPALHPFAALVGFRIEEQRAGFSRLTLEVSERHLNPHAVAHGAVLYALADTGMGAALYPTLAEGEICATLDVTISYFKPVAAGRLDCTTELVNRGRTTANLESRLFAGSTLVARASGTYSIFTPRGKPA